MNNSLPIKLDNIILNYGIPLIIINAIYISRALIILSGITLDIIE